MRALSEHFPATDLYRTENSIVVSGIGLTYPLQIVLRLFGSVNEVLSAFDVDCCAFAFDGVRVWALPRAMQALRSGCNTVNPQQHRSWAYESRLIKHAQRGCCFAPDLTAAGCELW